MSSEREVATTYLHVGNSGLTVKVVDQGWGPTFVVESSSFGNLNNSSRTHTTVEGLRAIRDMLDRAIAYGEDEDRGGYSEQYCHAAEAPQDKRERCSFAGRGIISWPDNMGPPPGVDPSDAEE